MEHELKCEAKIHDMGFRADAKVEIRESSPYSYRAFLAGVVPGRGVFHLHPATPLSLKSDDSNFVQNYFGVGSIFWGKKNRDQIGNNVTMTSSLL